MRPLAEKTVVVTRPRQQAAELKDELENLGATVVLFPTIEIAAPESYADLDRAIQNLNDYDWLILTSQNAAEHFINRLAANEVELFELDNLRLCAIGEATFERLRLSQIHVDVLPVESNAEAVFAAIAEYVGGENELRNLRFLFPKSAIARDVLPVRLRRADALIDEVVAYRTVLPEKPETGKIKALLHVGAIDCIAFSSPSTFKNFVEILKNENLHGLLKNVSLACIGETTANAVRESGFEVGIVSPAQTAADFARSIAENLR